MDKPQPETGSDQSSLPTAFLRYWPYLAFRGQVMNSIEFALVTQVLALKHEQGFELRTSDLPMTCASITVERAKNHLRQMGLVFTRRNYYPQTAQRKTPRMKDQSWDFRSLMYNLQQVSLLWRQGHQALEAQWAAAGYPGKQPVFSFPPGFRYEVDLPPELALDLALGAYHPLPGHWARRARELVAACCAAGAAPVERPPEPPAVDEAQPDRRTIPAGSGAAGLPACPDPSGTLGTCPETSGTLRTCPETSGHLSIDRFKRGGGESAHQETLLESLLARILDAFSQHTGLPCDRLTRSDHSYARALLEDGYELEEVLPGIEHAAARCKGRVRSFAYCARVIRQRRAEHSPPAGETPASSAPGPQVLVIDAHLVPAFEVCQAAGIEVDDPVLGRLRLMAAQAEAAAVRQGSSGGQWAADELRQAVGVARRGSPLSYANAVLENWVLNGRRRPARQVRAAGAGPGGHRKLNPAQAAVQALFQQEMQAARRRP